MTRSLRTGLVAAAAVLVGACSAADLAYRNADWLLMRYANGYLDLDDAQEARLSDALDAGLERHRRSELPHLVALLRDAREAAADRLTRGEAEHLVAQGRALWRATAGLGAEAAAPVLASLDDAQIDHLQARIAEANERYREAFLDPDPQSRFSKRVERFTERIGQWTGALSDAQRILVARHVHRLPDTASPWYAYREKQQVRLLATLRAAGGGAAVKEALRGWWVEQRDRPPELEARTEQLFDGIAAMLAELDATLSSAQRRHLLARLDDYVEDFSELVIIASDGDTPSTAATSPAMASAAVRPGDSIP